MQSSQSPTLMPLPFASAGGKNTIPEASQLPGSPGAASYTDGFPPATRTPLVAGGIPPAGLDMNGILYSITQSTRWGHAGGQYAWNSAFTTDTNVAGYPNGAQLIRADLTGFWLNTIDNNETNPDATDGSAANWVPGYNYGITPITGLTNANVTLAPAQAAKSKITLAGTLTGNVQIIFPTWTKEWEVVNNTTGAFTITAKTAAGTGITLAAGQQKITGDGTNITQPAENIAPATAGNHPVQLGQLASGAVNLDNRAQFTSSTAFTVPANVTTIWYSGGGAGGGGGGSGGISGVTNWTSTGGAGGGAAGQLARKQPLTVTPGQVLTITLGAGGAAGTAGTAGGNGGDGGNGGNTTITGTGVSVTLSGGSGGHHSVGITTTGVSGAPGAAGNAGASDGGWGIAISGYGYDFGGVGGNGGSTPFGQSGGTAASGLNSHAGVGSCAGGAGASGVVSSTGVAGVAGAAGMPGYLEFEW